MDPETALFQTLLIAQVVTGMIPGLLLLRRAVPASLALVGLVLLGVALAVLGFLLGTVVIGNGFAVLGLWFAAIVWVLAPLAVSLGVLMTRRGHAARGIALSGIGAMTLGTAWFATRVEPFRLQVAEHRIESARSPRTS